MLLTTVPSWILQQPTTDDFSQMQEAALKIIMHEMNSCAMLQLTSGSAFSMFNGMLGTIGHIDDCDCSKGNRWACAVTDEDCGFADIQNY